MSDAPNPYAVTTLEIARPKISYPDEFRLIRWTVLAAIPLMMIGSAAAVLEVGTIVFSGPVMLVAGVILVLLTHRKGQQRFCWFAWACCGFPVIVFLIIYLLSWSPGDAQVPISALCCVVAVSLTYGIYLTFARTAALAAKHLGEVGLKTGTDESSADSGAVSPPPAPSQAP